MKERRVIGYKNYFTNFIKSIQKDEARKVYYAIDVLRTQERISAKFAKHIKEGLFELRAEYNSNIFRVFFIFDNENIVMLFNGFQKKTQKTPNKEIEKAIKLKNEYYANKR